MNRPGRRSEWKPYLDLLDLDLLDVDLQDLDFKDPDRYLRQDMKPGLELGGIVERAFKEPRSKAQWSSRSSQRRTSPTIQFPWQWHWSNELLNRLL